MIHIISENLRKITMELAHFRAINVKTNGDIHKMGKAIVADIRRSNLKMLMPMALRGELK